MHERIKQVIKDTFGLNDVLDDFSQKTYAEWDSLRHLQLVLALETEFDISFEPEDIVSMNSLDRIEEKVKLLMRQDIEKG
jgi:acyl carrier protein